MFPERFVSNVTEKLTYTKRTYRQVFRNSSVEVLISDNFIRFLDNLLRPSNNRIINLLSSNNETGCFSSGVISSKYNEQLNNNGLSS